MKLGIQQLCREVFLLLRMGLLSSLKLKRDMYRNYLWFNKAIPLIQFKGLCLAPSENSRGLGQLFGVLLLCHEVFLLLGMGPLSLLKLKSDTMITGFNHHLWFNTLIAPFHLNLLEGVCLGPS